MKECRARGIGGCDQTAGVLKYSFPGGSIPGNRRCYSVALAVGSRKGGPCTSAGVALAMPQGTARRRSLQPVGRPSASAAEP